MTTETKSYTPGAERAARQVVNGCIDGATELDYSANAALISRETHDAEMLEALQELLEAATARVAPGLPDMDQAVERAVALIAKLEGR